MTRSDPRDVPARLAPCSGGRRRAAGGRGCWQPRCFVFPVIVTGEVPCPPRGAEGEAGNEFLLLLCLGAWFLPSLPSFAFFISTHEFSAFYPPSSPPSPTERVHEGLGCWLGWHHDSQTPLSVLSSRKPRNCSKLTAQLSPQLLVHILSTDVLVGKVSRREPAGCCPQTAERPLAASKVRTSFTGLGSAAQLDGLVDVQWAESSLPAWETQRHQQMTDNKCTHKCNFESVPPLWAFPI